MTSEPRPVLRRARADFAPARIAARPPTLRSAPRWVIRFEARDSGSGQAVRLDGDPDRARPAPVGRIVAHAVASLAVVLVLALAVVGMAPSLVGHRSVVVSSAAMSPSIGPGDVVVLRDLGRERLPVGAVVEADVVGGSGLRRVVGTTVDGYRVAADADDAAPGVGTVSAADVRGVVTMVVPVVGLPLVWWDEGRWLLLLALTGVMVAAAVVARRAWIDGPLRSPRHG